MLTYGELLENKDRVRHLWDQFGKNRGLNPFSALSLYTFIKKYKPKTIIEMSPDKGWSTFIMINAIKDTGYDAELKFFNSYDLSNKLTPEAKKMTELLGNRYTFYKGDAKKMLDSKLLSGLDFFFIDSDHSYSFAKWYEPYLSSVKAFFVDDIDPSEEYFMKREKLPKWTPEDVHCGSEPIVIYDWLKSKGYKYEDKTKYYDLTFSCTKLEADNHYKCYWSHNSEKGKLFWCQLEQEDFFNKTNDPHYKITNCRNMFFIN